MSVPSVRSEKIVEKQKVWWGKGSLLLYWHLLCEAVTGGQKVYERED